MSTPTGSLERRTMLRVMWRIVPLLMVCYVASYLDRVNVSFAALTMNRELGFSSQVYGLGAGIFFVTYFIFELPSNLMLHRFGARLWIARIMLTWGLVSGAMGFIPQIAAFTGLRDVTVFYTLRLLLGAAEAGFFPGVIFYLTLWFPNAYRARVVGYFMTALPLSSVIGGPLCGWLLGVGGTHGLSGWQWLFIIQAVPAIVLAFVLLALLTDRPAHATWLADDERHWLTTQLAREEQAVRGAAQGSVWRTLSNPLVIALGLVYFSVVYMNYTVGYFLPQIIHEFGLSNMATGSLVALPSAVGAISMVVWGRRSDRYDERKWHLVFALAVGAISFGAVTLMHTPFFVVLMFAFAAFGIYGCQPVFWTLPGAFLSGSSAAAGIAVINAVANVSGFAGPYLMGWLKTTTGSYTPGLLIASAMAVAATLLVASVRQRHFPTRTSVV